jgi:hypothetical protein
VNAAPETRASAQPRIGPLARLSRFLDHPAILPGLVLAGLLFAGTQAIGASRGTTAVYDAHAYWLAAGSEHPYDETIASGFDDTVNPFKYRYPPPLAQILTPATALPWPVFAGLWVGFLFVVFLVLAGRWALLVLLFPPLLGELYFANVNLLIALAIVLSFRWPAAWAFVVLTKGTPGIGALWFVFRGEWRKFGVAVGATLAVAAISYVVAPGWWMEFREALVVQAGAALDVPPLAIQIPLPPRLIVAVLVLAFAARTDRAWLVPVAATIAAPAIWGNVLVILVAAIPLAEGRGLDRPLISLPRLRRPRVANA